MPEGFHVGKIKTVDQVKGFCTVACATSGHAKDVYVHSTVADPNAVLVNDIVAFQIHVNRQGSPQASAPFWKHVGWRPKGKGVSFGLHQGLVAKLMQSGCGFVHCDQLKQTHGKDTYIHETVTKQCSLEEGNLIAFDAHISKSGNPQVSAPCWICCSSAELVQRFMPSSADSEQLAKGQAEAQQPAHEDFTKEDYLPADSEAQPEAQPGFEDFTEEGYLPEEAEGLDVDTWELAEGTGDGDEEAETWPQEGPDAKRQRTGDWA